MKLKIIFFFLDSLKSGTGGFASIFEMLTTLSNIGYEVHLILLRYDPLYSYRKHRLLKQNHALNINIHYIPGYTEILQSKFLGITIFKKVLSNLKQCFLKLSKKKIRVLIESLEGLLMIKKIKKFEYTLSKSDVIIKAATLSGIELMILRKKTNAIIIQNHAGSPQTYENYWLTKEQEPIHSDPNLSQYVNFCLGFDNLLFQSEDQALECARRHPQLGKRVLTIYPTCNETEVLKAKKQTNPYHNDIIVIVNVGTIQPRKAQHRSIEAFANISKGNPQAQLHFIGGWKGFNDYYNQLQAQVHNLDLKDRVVFHGHKSDYLRYMAYATILLQSSEAEGVSRVLRESMFMKLPIISFSIPGTIGILENKKEALLIEQKNTQALGIAIADLLNNQSKRNSLATAAFQRYQHIYSKNVYTKCLKNMVTLIEKNRIS